MPQHPESREAQYSVQFVATCAPPDAVRGWARIADSQIGGKLHTSEWVLAGGNIAEIDAAFVNSSVKMKHFRMYKPQDDQWCVIDGALLQDAIEHGFTVQV